MEKVVMQGITLENMRRLSSYIDGPQKDGDERQNWLEWRVLNMIVSEAIAGSTELVVSWDLISARCASYLVENGFTLTFLKEDARNRAKISWGFRDVAIELESPPKRSKQDH